MIHLISKINYLYYSRTILFEFSRLIVLSVFSFCIVLRLLQVLLFVVNQVVFMVVLSHLLDKRNHGTNSIMPNIGRSLSYSTLFFQMFKITVDICVTKPTLMVSRYGIVLQKKSKLRI